MNEAGYALTETLAALAVLGLAGGALTMSLHNLGRLQFSLTDRLAVRGDVRAARDLLGGDLALGQLFRSDQAERFSGREEGFEFDCGAKEGLCSAELDTAGRATLLKITDARGRERRARLPGGTDYRFLYQGRLSQDRAWPPEDPARQSLRGVTLLSGRGGDEQAVMVLRVWGEQPAVCDYDPVIGDCR